MRGQYELREEARKKQAERNRREAEKKQKYWAKVNAYYEKCMTEHEQRGDVWPCRNAHLLTEDERHSLYLLQREITIDRIKYADYSVAARMKVPVSILRQQSGMVEAATNHLRTKDALKQARRQIHESNTNENE